MPRASLTREDRADLDDLLRKVGPRTLVEAVADLMFEWSEDDDDHADKGDMRFESHRLENFAMNELEID